MLVDRRSRIRLDSLHPIGLDRGRPKMGNVGFARRQVA